MDCLEGCAFEFDSRDVCSFPVAFFMEKAFSDSAETRSEEACQ